jgi:four helix bundle protein
MVDLNLLKLEYYLKHTIKTLLLMAFKFENLKVWQKAVELSGDVSGSVKKFPKDDLFILTSQIKPATDSISLNIAEGSTGQSNPDFRKFPGYSLRSAIEVVGCIFIAKRRQFFTYDEFSYYYIKLTDLIKGVQALRNSLK